MCKNEGRPSAAPQKEGAGGRRACLTYKSLSRPGRRQALPVGGHDACGGEADPLASAGRRRLRSKMPVPGALVNHSAVDYRRRAQRGPRGVGGGVLRRAPGPYRQIFRCPGLCQWFQIMYRHP